MAEKACVSCGEVKPLDAFHRAKRAKDGRRSSCADCVNEAARRWTRENPEKRHAQNRRYFKAHQEQRRAQTQEWRKTNPEKRAAHRRVSRAIARGELTRPAACEQCADTTAKLHAHHDDYEKKLEVRWLCSPCHRKHHVALTSTPQQGETDG